MYFLFISIYIYLKTLIIFFRSLLILLMYNTEHLGTKQRIKLITRTNCKTGSALGHRSAATECYFLSAIFSRHFASNNRETGKGKMLSKVALPGGIRNRCRNCHQVYSYKKNLISNHCCLLKILQSLSDELKQWAFNTTCLTGQKICSCPRITLAQEHGWDTEEI